MSGPDVGLFLLGAGSGGTSLLTNLLNLHPGLEVSREAFAGRHLCGPADGKSSSSAQRDARMAAYLAACQEEARHHPGKFWGNKLTSEQLFRATEQDFSCQDEAEATLQAFLDQVVAKRKLIFVVRDARDVVVSKMHRANRGLEDSCRRWRFSAFCYRFLRDNHPEIHLLRFEDLLAAPEKELQDICAFLNLAFDPEILNGLKSDKTSSVYNQQGIEPRAPQVPAVAMAMIEEDLRACGYL